MATVSRQQMLSVVPLLLILVVAVAIVPAEPILKIRSTDFTRFNESSVEFVSSTSYNARGMAPLYEITNHVINLFVDETPIPESGGR